MIKLDLYPNCKNKLDFLSFINILGFNLISSLNLKIFTLEFRPLEFLG